MTGRPFSRDKQRFYKLYYAVGFPGVQQGRDSASPTNEVAWLNEFEWSLLPYNPCIDLQESKATQVPRHTKLRQTIGTAAVRWATNEGRQWFSRRINPLWRYQTELCANFSGPLGQYCERTVLGQLGTCRIASFQ